MLPAYLKEIIVDLRRRLPLCVADIEALRTALAAGFGWQSTGALRELCVSLWAKSTAEAAVIRVMFARPAVPRWEATAALDDATGGGRRSETGERRSVGLGADHPETAPAVPSTATRLAEGPRPLPSSGEDDSGLLLVPQYPVSERAIAQVWRRLRRPVRRGPRVELDVEATVRLHARTGVVTEPVLVPRRGNAARLVLLIDVGGSMSPYWGFVVHVRDSIARAARLADLTVRYFHDLPGHAHRDLLANADPERSDLDRVLHAIPPMRNGRIYADPRLTASSEWADLAASLTSNTAVAIVSDAGAARGRLDRIRLLDTVSFLKFLTGGRAALAWLNPAPPYRWRRTTAALVARHVPMFAVTQPGMYAAVDVLRGRAATVARPL